MQSAGTAGACCMEDLIPIPDFDHSLGEAVSGGHAGDLRVGHGAVGLGHPGGNGQHSVRAIVGPEEVAAAVGATVVVAAELAGSDRTVDVGDVHCGGTAYTGATPGESTKSTFDGYRFSTISNDTGEVDGACGGTAVTFAGLALVGIAVEQHIAQAVGMVGRGGGDRGAHTSVPIRGGIVGLVELVRLVASHDGEHILVHLGDGGFKDGGFRVYAELAFNGFDVSDVGGCFQRACRLDCSREETEGGNEDEFHGCVFHGLLGSERDAAVGIGSRFSWRVEAALGVAGEEEVEL